MPKNKYFFLTCSDWSNTASAD